MQNPTLQFISAQWEMGFLISIYTHHGLHALLLGENLLTVMSTISKQFPYIEKASSDSHLHHDMQYLLAYIKTPTHPYTKPLDLKGTSFQKTVWHSIAEIPWGETLTYTELAQKAGFSKAYRAVANACGANPLPIIFPCHRVVGKGNIGGYRWGTQLKYALLKKEKITEVSST